MFVPNDHIDKLGMLQIGCCFTPTAKKAAVTLMRRMREMFAPLNDDTIAHMLGNLDPLSLVALAVAVRYVPGARPVCLKQFSQGSRFEYGDLKATGFGSAQNNNIVVIHRGLVFSMYGEKYVRVDEDDEGLVKLVRMLKARRAWDGTCSFSADALRKRLIDAL